MTIDITSLARMVRRFDVGATLKAFAAVMAFLFVLTNLRRIHALVTRALSWGLLDSENAVLWVAPIATAVIAAFFPLTFLFWDWLSRKPWRHLAALAGALLGAVGFAAIGLAIGHAVELHLRESSPSDRLARLFVGSAATLSLLGLGVWIASGSKRVQVVVRWALGSLLALVLLALGSVFAKQAGVADPGASAAGTLRFVGLVLLSALVFGLLLRAVRHSIVLSGDRPRELFLGALHRRGFWVRLAFLAGLPSSLWRLSALGTPAFWAFLLSRPLVYAGFLVVLGTADERLGVRAGPAVGGGLILGGHLLFQAGKRLAARNIWRPEVAGRSGRPVLFLRSFADDQLRFHRPWWDLVGRWLDLWSFRRNADEAMIDEIAQYGPVVALGMPGEKRMPFGAMRHYSTHEDWQQLIRATARRARAIVLAAADTPGVRWEVELLARESLLDRTLVLLPPTAGDRAAQRRALRTFAEASGVRDGRFEVADDRHAIALLQTPRGPRLLTARRATAAAYVVAVRAHFQGCSTAQLADPLTL